MEYPPHIAVYKDMIDEIMAWVAAPLSQNDFDDKARWLGNRPVRAAHFTEGTMLLSMEGTPWSDRLALLQELIRLGWVKAWRGDDGLIWYQKADEA